MTEPLIKPFTLSSLKPIEAYDLLEIVGHGGMSTVYRARDRRASRIVALKLMYDYLAVQQDIQQRFLLAGRAVAALDHPNIIRIVDVGMSGPQLYMAMEYVAGGTLRQHLNACLALGQLLPLREVVSLTRQIAQALQCAHSSGIIHRDVKPDNVLLRLVDANNPSSGWEAILTDFGLAKPINGVGVASVKGELLGTLAYMAPEQFRGQPMDGRSDVYALGVMLYELVTGQLPFVSDSAANLIMMHSQGEPEVIQDLRPGIPPALISIIHRAMIKNPNDRYQSVAEVARVLEALEKSIKTIEPSERDFIWTVRPPKSKLAGAMPETPTIFDVLPTLDRPAIPVDLMSEGDGDLIIVTPPSGPSWSLPLEKPTLVAGRDLACELLLDQPTVSHKHVRIDRLPDGRVSVTDLGSLNGLYLSDIKLEKNMIALWSDTQSVKVGVYWLTLRLARTAIGQSRRTSAPPRTLEMTTDNGDAIIRLTPAEVIVEPGSSVTIHLEVLNRRDTERDYNFSIEGIPADWYTVADYPLRVPRHERSERTISFHPPRVPTSAAISYRYMLGVIPDGAERPIGLLVASLQVFPFYDFSAEVLNRTHSTTVSVTNTGNSPRYYVTEIRDRQNRLLIMPARNRTLIMPGQTNEIELKVQPKHLPLTGLDQVSPVEIFVRTDGIRPQTLTFDYTIRPTVAWWVPIILLVVGFSFILFVLSHLG